MRNNYNYIAWIYDFLVKLIFRNQLQKASCSFIHRIQPDSAVLIIGGGTGYTLEQILLHTQASKIVYIDVSRQMIKKAKKRIKSLETNLINKVKFICGTENDISSDLRFDIVYTHFLLDLYPQQEMEELLTKISSHSKPTTEWHFADFQKGNTLKQKYLLKLMYLFFRLTTNVSATTLPDFQSAFKKLGLTEIESIIYNKGMIKSSVFKVTK